MKRLSYAWADALFNSSVWNTVKSHSVRKKTSLSGGGCTFIFYLKWRINPWQRSHVYYVGKKRKKEDAHTELWYFPPVCWARGCVTCPSQWEAPVSVFLSVFPFFTPHHSLFLHLIHCIEIAQPCHVTTESLSLSFYLSLTHTHTNPSSSNIKFTLLCVHTPSWLV